jgi:hypothetical protein
MAVNRKKSLGECIDSLIEALKDIDHTAREIAIKAACEHLDIPLSVGAPKEVDLSAPGIAGRQQQPTKAVRIIDLRTLREQKRPKGAVEMACIVAYYLQQYAQDAEKKSEMTARDIDKYFRQAGFRLPKVAGQVLVDGKAAGYFDSIGKGKYKLNAVGYNLVAHSLPRSGGKK